MIDLSENRRGRRRLADRASGAGDVARLDAATQAFGFVTPGGVVGSTGVAGLTLGGGIGHHDAVRLTCDNLVGAEPSRRMGRWCGQARRGYRAAVGPPGWRRQFRRRHTARVPAPSTERLVGGLPRLPREGCPRRAAHLPRSPRRLAATLSCQAILALDESAEPMLVIAPCHTGTDPRPEELRCALGARGRERRRARAPVPRAAGSVRLALRREPSLLEGPLRRRVPGRAVATSCSSASARWGDRPATS